MQLPIKNSLLFWFDPSERFVFRDSSNKITSVIEKVSDTPLLPVSSSSAPTWVADVVNGQPAVLFGGAHALRFSFAPRVITSGTKNPIVISVAAKANSFAVGDNTIQALGSITLSNPSFSLSFSSASFLQAYRFDDTGGASDAAATISPPTSTAWHIYTAIYDGTNVILRVDGTQIATVAATNNPNHFTGDQMVIGDYTDGAVGGFGHGYFNGYIGQVIVYGGVGSPDLDPEIYLKQYYGI